MWAPIEIFWTSRKFIITLTFLCVMAACDRPEAGTGRLEQKRCAKDGVCWQAVGKHSLEGAYRKGDNEIKFDAIFSPGRTLMTQFKDEWSIRLLDRLGLTFFSAPSSNPPERWLKSQTSQDFPWKDNAEETHHLRERSEAAYEMAQAVVRAEKPSGSLREPWRQLCGYLQERIIDSESYGIRPLDPPESFLNTEQSTVQATENSANSSLDDEESKLRNNQDMEEDQLDIDEPSEDLI